MTGRFDEQDNNPADPEQAGYEPYICGGLISSCCSAPIIENSDFCGQCKEHCEGVPEE